MKSLCEQIKGTLAPGMYIPEPLERLFEWIEKNKLFIERDKIRIGFLYPDEKLRSEWTETERPGGTIIEFYPEGNVNLHYWFDNAAPSIIDRLCIFARTGAEGSMAAFWLDENNEQKIVHLRSGSGSVMACVLADDPVDFLRLIAIGYDEICWNSEFSNPPNHNLDEDECRVLPNIKFQSWVANQFNTIIPKLALEIVKFPAEMGDTNSQDQFCQWLEKIGV